jgi:hypothetical protein
MPMRCGQDLNEEESAVRSNPKDIATTAAAAFAALALAAAPVAAAPPEDKPEKPEKPGKPDKPAKPGPKVSYVFKGSYSGASTVAVEKGNKHARDFEGQSVVFDLSAAKVSVADTNGDGAADVNDVVAGDKVVVKAKLPKKETPSQPIAAKHLVDQTNPAPEESPEG